MVMATISATLVQFFAFSAWGAITPTQGWVRGGVIGMWSVATTAAGIVGFQRYRGTLVYLVLAPVGALRVLAALVASAATCGLGAFPLAWVTWALCAGSVSFTTTDAVGWARIAAGVVALFIGCVSLSFAVATLFVLTPNAISYEGLVLVPVFLASGILFTSSAPGWVGITSALLPLRLPFELLSLGPISTVSLWAWPLSVAAWSVLSWLGAKRAIRLATRAGTLEVI
ncbi:ABC transporter permease [Nanchangia anserum]|uniref:ABC transporter permease n=2 Tax=Nanchangia anserum TaxID=2692125 RepID=A0A8I0GCH3_9ACTO|nr:ABC transporter permease [Nanchangia anserum]QOX82623.1 ABC transporter permease [Nanchangia anserum]